MIATWRYSGPILSEMLSLTVHSWVYGIKTVPAEPCKKNPRNLNHTSLRIYSLGKLRRGFRGFFIAEQFESKPWNENLSERLYMREETHKSVKYLGRKVSHAAKLKDDAAITSFW
jgi:hypothetical protein